MKSKKLQVLAVSLVTSYYSFGQSSCVAGTGQLSSVMNNYNAHFLTDNDMGWNLTTNKPNTFIPYKDSISPIFASSAWMGGYVNGNLHTACMTYRQNGVDFWPGPIDPIDLHTSASECSLFDTFYPIRKTQVDSQKNHLYTTGTIPSQITNWPANGIAADTTSYKLAPYVDVNHNNTYDPINGDYPIMYGDYSIYQINNDEGNHHGETGGLNIGLETHITNYMIDCTTDSALWNTLFMHYEIINRSNNTVNNFLFSMWSDFDLGNPTDDYVGCDTTLNMYYVYNGDGYDNDYTGGKGYHQYLPAFAGVFLNQKMSRFTYYNNSSNPLNGNPVGGQPQQYYNLMNGVWVNGAPMTYGNSGVTAGGIACQYLYPGDPVANTGWTEANSGQVPLDVRGQGSCGPYTFNPGDTLKVDFAYVFARDYAHPGDSVACIPILKQYVQNVQSYYNSGTTPCGTPFYSSIKQVGAGNSLLANIYPNPSTGNFTIETASDSKQTLTMYDVNGKVVLTQPINGTATIDASALSSGIYNLNVVSDKGVVNKKVVIVK